jgi:hypothetical protein
MQSGLVPKLRGIKENTDEGLAVLNFAVVDEAEDFGERSHVDLDLLVVLGGSLAESEIFGEKDGHGFCEEAGAGIVIGVFRPLFGAIASLFDEFALAGGKEFFAGFDAARRKFEEDLAGGVAVLADEEDVGVGGVGFGVDSEDDDGAVVADDVATAGDAAGLNDLVAGDPEGFALVDGLGGKSFAFACELEGGGGGGGRGGLLGGCVLGGCLFGGCLFGGSFLDSHVLTVHDAGGMDFR